jgi:hypothetical protein
MMLMLSEELKLLAQLISHGTVFLFHNKTVSAGLSAAKPSAEQLVGFLWVTLDASCR